MIRPTPRIVTSTALILTAAAVLVSVLPSAARAQSETDESAIWQLKTATMVHRDRSHNVLLRALRQLRDPKLEPLFSDLVQHKFPDLQIHGILGLGEIDPKERINLALVADLKSTSTQAQVVSLAAESDLLDVDQCQQLMSWPELDLGVKMIVAPKLVSEGALKDKSVIEKALAQQDNAALRAMAALLKTQLGEPEGIAALNELQTPQFQAMVFQTALNYDMDKIGPWAMKILAANPESQQLRFMALRAAVEFEQDGADERLVEAYRAADSVADRIRLAVLAMELAEKLDPKVFELMSADEEPIIQYMGRTGKALASGGDATELMLKLVEQNHLLASKWVLSKADDFDAAKAKPIYLGIILAAEAEPDDPRFRGQRIEHAVLATQQLIEREGGDAALIKRLFKQVPDLTAEAMLMGLIRAEAEANAHLAIEGIDDMPSDTADALALLLRAKHGVKLSDAQLEQLGLIVRGGAGLQAPLRIQASWVYGKITGQEKVYLASVLDK